MKRQIRVAAFDDGPFRSRHGSVPFVCVVARLPSYVEAVSVTHCTVDGKDANECITKTVLSSRMRDQIRAIFLDGIACGGFNIYDLSFISASTGLPVISVTRNRPDIPSMVEALRKHFPDWQERAEGIRRYTPSRIECGKSALYVRFEGIEQDQGTEIICNSLLRGNYPEPIRLAHIIAGGITAGESRGRA